MAKIRASDSEKADESAPPSSPEQSPGPENDGDVTMDVRELLFCRLAISASANSIAGTCADFFIAQDVDNVSSTDETRVTLSAMKVSDPDSAQSEEGEDAEQGAGPRRRSIATDERKQAFGRKNESLNQRKVSGCGITAISHI